jgi:hypothetical protein
MEMNRHTIIEKAKEKKRLTDYHRKSERKETGIKYKKS